MFAILAVSVLIATVGAQSCRRPQDLCLKVGASHMCPNGMGCIINKLDDDKSYCCALTDIVNTPPVPPVQPSTAAPRTCVDKINPATGYSDCPQRAYLCNNYQYKDLMTDQCPRTCNRCGANGNTNVGGTPGGNTNGNGNGTGGRTCVDQVNPSTGVSDCPARRSYCNNAAYRDLMRDQCPRTCGFC